CGRAARRPLAGLHRHEGIAVLVSRHRDGELITRVIERLGFVAARGSSTRGGEAGVRGMLAWAGQDRHLAVTPDGPRGPAEQVKAGAVFLAERTGRRMVPIGVAARPAQALHSWDRFRVPWPFARVLVSHGAPLAPHSSPPLATLAGTEAGPSAGAGQDEGVSRDESEGDERARREFEDALSAVTRDVRERVGERL